MAAAALNGIIYAIGGYNGSVVLATNEAFTPACATVPPGGAWATKASIPSGHYSFDTGVVNGILYAVGGANTSGVVATNEASTPACATVTPSVPSGSRVVWFALSFALLAIGAAVLGRRARAAA